MRVRKRFLFLVLLVVIFFFHDRFLGMAAESFLERKLTNLFNMPISIHGLRIRPWPCQIHLDYFVIHNPPDFRGANHFVAEQADIAIDASLLKNKFVRIKLAHFKKAFFSVESYMTPQGSRTNVKVWYRHMGLDQESPVPAVPHPKPPPDNAGEPNWRVRIDRLELENGTINLTDRRTSPERHWIFRKIKGFWTGFDFVSDYFSPTFNEFIKVESTFGENPPALFRGEGKCQFADGDNFDVKTEILGGSVTDYDFLLDGLPGEVQGGTFDLYSQMKCVEGNLDSLHRLRLRSLKIVNPTPTQALLKYPLDAALVLLENHKTVELEIEVKGDIDDPKFGILSAFTKALQKALLTKAAMPIKGLGKGTVELGKGTVELGKGTVEWGKGTFKMASETPKQMQNGLGKLGSLLTDPVTTTIKNLESSSGKKEDVSN